MKLTREAFGPKDADPTAHLKAHISKLVTSPKIGDAAAAALHAQLLAQICESEPEQVTFVSWCVGLLKEQFEAAKAAFVKSTKSGPVYGCLQCLRRVLASLDCSKPSAWRAVLSSIVSLTTQVGELVFPIVSDGSPEGFVPEEEREHIETADLADASQLITVCAWRSMKEVSLLLAQLVVQFPWTSQSAEERFLPVSCGQSVGELFLRFLITSKHKGAVDLLAIGFHDVCEMLFRCPGPELSELPKTWLASVLDGLADLDPNSVTRRSAGVAQIVLAVCTSEAKPRTQLKKWFPELLNIARQPTTKELPVAKIHAFNIARCLVRDAKLSGEMEEHVAGTLQLAILGFSEVHFSLRNSAMMLFSATVHRIFGKKSKGDFDFENRASATSFFRKYSGIKTFLLERMELATASYVSNANNSAKLHPELQPLLIVLGKLYATHRGSISSTSELQEFEPLVARCYKRFVFHRAYWLTTPVVWFSMPAAWQPLPWHVLSQVSSIELESVHHWQRSTRQ